MAPRYVRAPSHDEEDDLPTPTRASSLSPPPSFRSLASDQGSGRRVNQALEDAFHEDDSDDDDDDDRQLLARSRTPATPRPGRIETPPTPSLPPAAAAAATASPAAAVTAPPQPSASAGSRASSGRIYGSGTQSDGVFSNLVAKPERAGVEKEEQPPTYEQAAADAAPPYWETTILAPNLGSQDEVFIDGLPVGSLFSFLWNGLISWAFQLVGFVLTYLLHTTHAAKNGSRAGLGITLIYYGFYMRNAHVQSHTTTTTTAAAAPAYLSPADPNSHNFSPSDVNQRSGSESRETPLSGSEWGFYILMVAGWYILIRAVGDYIKARRHEQLVLNSPDRGLGVAVIAEGEIPDRVA